MKLPTRLQAILSILLCTSIALCAQENRVVDILVENGQRYDHLVPEDMKFLLRNFEECRLFTNSGEELTGLVNPDIMNNTLLLLTSAGDTLQVANFENISRIIAQNSVILYREGKYVSVISEYGDIALSEMPVLDIEFEFFSNSAGQPSGIKSQTEATTTSKTGSYTVIYSADRSSRLNAAKQQHYENIERTKDIITVRCTYTTEYVLVIGENIYPCKLSSFTKAFPEWKKAIREFAESSHTNFTNRESLQMLFEFCTGQQ